MIFHDIYIHSYHGTQNSFASPNNKDKFIDISNAYKTILKTFTKHETKI